MTRLERERFLGPASLWGDSKLVCWGVCAWGGFRTMVELRDKISVHLSDSGKKKKR